MSKPPESLKSADGLDLSKIFPADNQFFTGGFTLAALGAGAAMLRRSWQMAMMVARRHCLSTLEVTSKDRSFPWVLHWMSTQGKSNTNHLSLETSFLVSAARQQAAGDHPNPHSSAYFGFVPGPGMHLLKYKNKWIGVERSRELTSTDLNSGKPWEKVTMTILGRNTSVFAELLEEAFENATRQQEGKTIVYTNWGTEWRPFGQPRNRRPIESVVLDEGIADKLLSDLKEWRGSKPWYIERGMLENSILL
jgi:chaperone BCS1